MLDAAADTDCLSTLTKSEDLLKFEVIDGIIKEPAEQVYTDEFIIDVATKMKNQIIKDIEELKKMSAKELVEHRYNKFRKMGC